MASKYVHFMRNGEGKCVRTSLKEKQSFLLVKNLLMANVFLPMEDVFELCNSALTGGGGNGLLLPREI